MNSMNTTRWIILSVIVLAAIGELIGYENSGLAWFVVGALSVGFWNLETLQKQ